MKKLSVLSLTATFITLLFFLFSNNLEAQKIEGWFITGSNPNGYEIGLDKSIYKTEPSSSFLKSIDKKVVGFGTLMQSCSASEYLGKRVKMSAYIKSKNVTGWAGMWLRIDAKQGRKNLGFDNMRDRPIKNDNDWAKYEIILDVPEESGKLNYGILLNGEGEVWFDNIKFEVVDKLKTKQTSVDKPHPNKKPINLDFSK